MNTWHRSLYIWLVKNPRYSLTNYYGAWYYESPAGRFCDLVGEPVIKLMDKYGIKHEQAATIQ